MNKNIQQHHQTEIKFERKVSSDCFVQNVLLCAIATHFPPLKVLEHFTRFPSLNDAFDCNFARYKHR